MESTQSMPEQVKQWKPSRWAFRGYLSPDVEQCRGGSHPQPDIVDLPIVVKLTKEIVKTYQSCSASFSYSDAFNPKRYLTNPSVPASNGGFDNENSDLILAVNGVLVNGDTNHRYVIKDLLGQGTFGQVAKCWSHEMNSFVAVKIIKNQPAYRQQAIVEISILNMLNGKYDPEDKHHIVRIFEYFTFKEHLCIVFEMLGLNLFELLKVNNFKGISLNLIRSFTKQILTALMVLRDASVIHCDLKPENILLTTRLASAELKLIDFGSACREYRTVYSYIQSRFYRSPEVVLGHEYTTAIDMWSFGCVAAELFLGLPLFPAQSQYDLLQRMITILGGGPPEHILRNAKNTSKYFKHARAPPRHCDNSEGQGSAYQFLTPEDYELREKTKPIIGKHYFAGNWNLEQIIMSYHMKKGMSPGDIEAEHQKRFVFMDFIKGLVNFDPLKRWTPRQAAQHPFVTQKPFTGSFQPPVEAPRVPIRQGMTVDHNPVSGHWLGAGLSPQVNRNVLHFGSPHFQGHPFSYGSSYGSAGSFGDGGVGLGTSIGSYGEPSGAFVNHRPPSGIVNPAFGISPETWRRMGQVPTNQGFGHAYLGMSPSNYFTPLSLGVSPSTFTPPSSSFQNSPGSSTGSPSRYGPLSPPAWSSGGGASSLGKAAALGQFNKRRGWGSPGSAGSANSGSQRGGIESYYLSWHGVHQNLNPESVDPIPSSYNDRTSPSGSPRSFSHHGSHRMRNGVVSGPALEQTQTFKLSTYPIGSLGALMSKAEPASTGGEDASPPPNPGDWDSNYSEDLLFENEGGETIAGSTFLSPPGVVTRMQGLGVLVTEGSDGRVYASNGMSQDGPHSSVFRQGNTFPVCMEDNAQIFHGWVPRPPHFNPQSQQISPSRLRQQSSQILQQQYPAFNLNLPEQLAHSVPHMQHNSGSQSNSQARRNESLIGAFAYMSDRKDS